MSKRKNVFTRIGRPVSMPKPPGLNKSTGERQSFAPSDGFRPQVPAKAYRSGGPVRHHDDPGMMKRGKC